MRTWSTQLSYHWTNRDLAIPVRVNVEAQTLASLASLGVTRHVAAVKAISTVYYAFAPPKNISCCC